MRFFASYAIFPMQFLSILEIDNLYLIFSYCQIFIELVQNTIFLILLSYTSSNPMQTLFYDIMEDDRSILLIIKICFTAFQLGFAREKNMLETRENLKILNSLVRETHSN